MTTLRTIWYAITGAKKFRVLRLDRTISSPLAYFVACMYADGVGGVVINDF